MGSWRVVGDSQVYCELELEVDAALDAIARRQESFPNGKITLVHFLGKVMGNVLKDVPQLNAIVRFNRIYLRKRAGIFFHVLHDETELSGCMIQDIDRESIESVATRLSSSAKKIRQDQDESFRKVKNSWAVIPSFFSRAFLDLITFFSHSLNWNLEKIGVPQDAFGSMMITNIGSLGFKRAFVPLAPYTRIPLVFALGRIYTVPGFNEAGQVVPKRMVNICITFDHRIIDGGIGAKVASRIELYFKNPQLVMDGK